MKFTNNFRDFINHTLASKETGTLEKKGYYKKIAEFFVKNKSYFGYDDVYKKENENIEETLQRDYDAIISGVRKTIYNTCKPKEAKRGTIQDKELNVKLDHLEYVCNGSGLLPNDILLTKDNMLIDEEWSNQDLSQTIYELKNIHIDKPITLIIKRDSISGSILYLNVFRGTNLDEQLESINLDFPSLSSNSFLFSINANIPVEKEDISIFTPYSINFNTLEEAESMFNLITNKSNEFYMEQLEPIINNENIMNPVSFERFSRYKQLIQNKLDTPIKEKNSKISLNERLEKYL